MQEYWQKKPLLIRGAIPAFTLDSQNGSTNLASPISYEELVEYANQENLESRLIQSDPWRFQHGPFQKKAIPNLNKSNWTLLLQGMEAHHLAAANILSWFRFIPDARLDDLMISIAGAGGGVGPHFDSYDVFLLQGDGTRRWRIGAQKDLTLIDDAPLRLLKNFRSRQAWDVATGDLLYLPPRYAHDGVATASCMTLSVGFRAPLKQELAAHFLDYLQDNLRIDGMIEDAGLPLQAHPAQLPPFLMDKFSRVLSRVR